jgi:hypothetical protein
MPALGCGPSYTFIEKLFGKKKKREVLVPVTLRNPVRKRLQWLLRSAGQERSHQRGD